MIVSVSPFNAPLLSHAHDISSTISFYLSYELSMMYMAFLSTSPFFLLPCVSSDSSYKSFASLISPSLFFSKFSLKPSTNFLTQSSIEISSLLPSFRPTYNLLSFTVVIIIIIIIIILYGY